MQTIMTTDCVLNLRTVPRMVSASERLKELRLSAVPPLSIRRMAEEAGLGFPRYAYFEDPKRFKKRELPIDVARQIAVVLAKRGVDPIEVMKLAGLTPDEAEPEAHEIEAARPAIQYVSLPVALPSEATLSEMFHSLLAYVPEGASRDEAARILAQRLPSGLSAIGPVALVPSSVVSIEAGEAPPAPARDRPAPAHESRT